MLSPQVQWVTASPLWKNFTPSPAQMQRPALLRFASDTFMEDLTALVQSQPEKLVDFIARAESFRARLAGESTNAPPPPPQLKFYQPAHGHFNLVAASLVCRLTGMPDRSVNTAKAERVGFVMRRLNAAGHEMAWVNDPVQDKGWQTLTPDNDGDFVKLAPHEELLPMFPVNFTESNRRRRLLVGLIPTASREAFEAAPALSPLTVDPATDPRLEEAETRVVDMLQALKDAPNALPAAQAREISLFILLDLADFLATTLPAPWNNVLNNPSATVPASSSSYQLYNRLNATNAEGTTKWLRAMRDVWAQRDSINLDGTTSNPVLAFNLKNSSLSPGTLKNDLSAALGTYTPPATPPQTIPVPRLEASAGALYVLRCVYQRPQCGPLKPEVVSSASERFTIAPFFDFDAPSRPIRISLPVDTSLSGLRKFKKNVAFLISDKLREQMNCAVDLKSALDGNLACSQSFNLGTICSFSIPIITICAMIVLMIFVSLLNIVFWWLPFLKICLPLKLKAK
jgi:hypothetical protein